MKKYIKYLIGTLFFIGLCANGFSIGSNSKTYATSQMLKDADVLPPTGSITVEDATHTDGKFYISYLDITLNITAKDNKSKSENMLMIVSGDKLTESELADEKNWEPYSATKEWSLSEDKNGENHIYLYLKDEAGNISNSILISSSSTYKISYSGDGKGLPEDKETMIGVVFNVSAESPKLTGKYFLGWSETPNDGSVQWGVDGRIEPQYIKGNKTLYAVYSDTPPLLADMVQIGDYVDYPADYTNVYDAIGTGWRVIGFDGDKVKLVSAGTPLAYMIPGPISSSDFHAVTGAEEITNNFLYTSYPASGFTGSLSSNFKNKYTLSARSIKMEDLQTLTNGNIKYGENISKYGSLVRNGSPYWIADRCDIGGTYTGHGMYCIHNANTNSYSASHGNAGNILGHAWFWRNTSIYITGYSKNAGIEWGVAGDTEEVRQNSKCGVRPVVTLYSDVTTTGRANDGAWTLTDMEGPTE